MHQAVDGIRMLGLCRDVFVVLWLPPPQPVVQAVGAAGRFLSKIDLNTQPTALRPEKSADATLWSS